MPAKVILNPYANRWNSQKRWPEAEAALKTAGVDFDLVVSEYSRHPIELATEAVRKGFSPIIAAGGDGTVGEVVNGLARAAKSKKALLGPLGIMPLGSANDLVCNLGLPLDLKAAAYVIASGNVRKMDIGSVNGLYFVNNSAVGLEPCVSLIQQHITWIKGTLRYIVAALIGIAQGPHWAVKMKWDDGEYTGPVTLVTVGNGARTGGLYMAPHADPFDGKLTFVYGYRRTRGGMLTLFPKTMKPGPGNYVEMEGIHEKTATRLKIHMDGPSPAHTDGEIFSTDIQDLEYCIYPGRLKILMPG